MILIRALGLAGALVLSAVVGGSLIGSALAQDEETDAATPYCDTFMDTLASELGATRDELIAAGRTAAIAALDAAVEASDLSEERATQIRSRIESADGTGCGWFGPRLAHRVGHGPARGFLAGEALDAAADALGIERAELLTELRDADSLESVAERHDVAYADLTASILAAVEADLDATDADPDRVDALIGRLTDWLENGGQLEGIGHGPFGHHHPFGDRDVDEGRPGS